MSNAEFQTKQFQEIERGIELLAQCLVLQSEKDGIDRPVPFAIDKTKTLDQFAKDVYTASTNMAALHKLIPQMQALAKVGKKLESEGKIKVDYGEDYADSALKFILKQHEIN